MGNVDDFLYNLTEEDFSEFEALVKIAIENPDRELSRILKELKRMLEPLPT